MRQLVCCGREATQTDGHIFEGATHIEWFCEICGKVLKRVEVEPREYVPVLFCGEAPA
jgi:hypothetical protein